MKDFPHFEECQDELIFENVDSSLFRIKESG